MNTYDLTDDVAVITGGAQGIGLACAERFVASGCRVVIWDIASDELDRALDRLGEAATAEVVDITDPDVVQAAADRAEATHGKITILLNSAGIAGMNESVDAYPIDEWLRVVNLNLNGTFFTNRAIVAAMKRNGYGRIVNIASIAGKEGNPNASAYSASKAGVIGFTKSLAKEVADLEIAVNCITPAAARTPIFDQMTDEHIAYMLSKIPRGRFVETNEIAAMVGWLVSRENSFTTGAVFDLSGGRATY